MPFQPADDVVSLEFRFTWQGQKVENVTHFFKESFTPGDMGPLAAAAYDWWVNDLSTQVSSTVQLREVYVTDLRTADGPTATYAPATISGGSNVNESVTNNTTLCLSLRTSARGRSRRGRLYHIGLTENVVTDNRVSVAARNGLTTAYGNLLSVATDEGWAWSVLSRQNAGVLRPIASAATITAVLFVDDVVDSQRRRLPGRGT